MEDTRSPVKAKQRFWKGRSVVPLALLFLLMIAGSVWVATRNDAYAVLVRTANGMPHRTAAGRLSGKFVYRPFVSTVTRGEGGTLIESLRVSASAAALRSAMRRDTRPEALHRIGESWLLSGHANDAVITLEDALRRATGIGDLATAIARSEDADTLSDLAAAYLDRADSEDSTDHLAAVNAAERAWRIHQAPAVAWNRALAFSAASSREAAVGAWRDYRAVESDPQWAQEGERRASEVADRGPSSRQVMKTALTRALSAPDDERLLRAVSAGVGYARLYVEDELLPEWGRGGDHAESALSGARHISAAIARVSGDWLDADSVHAIDSLRATHDPRETAARAALAQFGKGRAALIHYKYVEALEPLVAAEDHFRSVGIPLAARAAVFVATLDFYAQHPDSSLVRCAKVTEQNDVDRYPSVTAQCAWNAGTIETGRRHYDRAKAAFETARTFFGRMNDVNNVAAVDVRLQENARWTGDVTGAWSHMSSALRNGAADRGYIPLAEAARVAEAAGMPFAALAFYRSAIEAAETNRSIPEQADGHLSRAQVLWNLGNGDEARIELNAATRFMHAIGDPKVIARLKPDLALAHCALLLASRPAEVIQQTEQISGELAATGNRRKIAQAHFLQARAHLALRDTRAAESSLRAALAEIESQRKQISTDEERLALVDTEREVSEALIALLYDSNRRNEALSTADQWRGQLLLEAVTDSDVREEGSVTAPMRGEAFIEYVVLRDRVLVWSVTQSGTRDHSVAIDREKLEGLITAWRAALSAGDERGVRAKSDALSEILLRPVWLDVQSCGKLVFAPHAVLHRVPFCALSIPARHEFLVEEYVTSNVPSIAWLAKQRRLKGQSGYERVLIVSPTAGPQSGESAFARLPAAEEDGRWIRNRFPRARLLQGDAATASTISTAIHEADLFHFAGHAVVDERRPSRSALVLGHGEMLRASEIAQWHLSTRLVVLDACATSSGRITTDGSASLARAFLLAGSHAAVATLWLVEDDAASELSRRFYGAIAAGNGVSEALRIAQRFMIHGTAAQPHFDWAAFESIGS
jgi:CHAT domain-containing protein